MRYWYMRGPFVACKPGWGRREQVLGIWTKYFAVATWQKEFKQHA